MVSLFLGTARPAPFSMTSFGPFRRHISLQSSQLSLPRTGFFPIKRILQACLQSTAASGDAGVQLPGHQSEIIFVGIGTSEGIPRVSCLTNPSKKCPVCTKAAEPGNRNKRLNTSILIQYPGPSGICNILIDAGKPTARDAYTWRQVYDHLEIIHHPNQS